MPVNRREFLKIGGLALIGLVAAKPAVDMLQHLKQTPEKSAVEAPVTGKRLAIAIDLKACTANKGCRVCIDACNKIHNIPDFGEPKDEIKSIWTSPFEETFQETSFTEQNLVGFPTLVLCNHCDNPPCVRVCPTQATFKREDGIVMMDYHRCIGCRYCMAACPYGARSFNWRDPRPFIKDINPDFPTRTRGVVEKCNLCEERLAKGLIPACVDVCPQKAMYFGDLEDSNSKVREILRSRYSIQRKPELGTKPQIYYLV